MPASIEESIDLLRVCATAGDRDSQYELARLLFIHRNDGTSALLYAKMAADQGHVEAAFCCGVLLASNNYGELSRQEMISYLTFAADFGHPRAGKLLWLMLRNNEGLECFEYAALMGDIEGDINSLRKYALLQRDGLGLDKDLDGSIATLRKCADGGDSESQYELS
jgi:TPR repeat protein